jgi:hypothetical protein
MNTKYIEVDFNTPKTENAAVNKDDMPVYITPMSFLINDTPENVRELLKNAARFSKYIRFTVADCVAVQVKELDLSSEIDDTSHQFITVHKSRMIDGCEMRVTFYKNKKGGTIVSIHKHSGSIVSGLVAYGTILSYFDTFTECTCYEKIPNVPETGGIPHKSILRRS